MTRDDIIKMWKESGDIEIVGMPYSKVAHFAQLVAEHEREACAQVCDPFIESLNDRVTLTALNIQSAIRARGQQSEGEQHD